MRAKVSKYSLQVQFTPGALLPRSVLMTFMVVVLSDSCRVSESFNQQLQTGPE
jgi:hypothetical protein